MAKKKLYNALKKININGTEQWIMIRYESPNHPLLLFLHGGPGGSEIATAYTHYEKSELEKQFIVVHWDQRGSGKSYSTNLDPNTMTIDQLANDGIELSKILLREFGKSKLYLVGHSWGSILGIRMLRKNEGLFASYIGISQLVYMNMSEKRSLDIAIDLAHKKKNKKAIQELCTLKNFDANNGDYLTYMDIHRSWLAKLGGLYYSGKGIHPNMLFVGALFSPEYRISDVFKLKSGLKFSVKHMWEEIMEINLLSEACEFDLPIHFIVGKADTIADPQLIKAYHDKISSPRKGLIEFECSGHSPQLDQWNEYEEAVIQFFLQ